MNIFPLLRPGGAVVAELPVCREIQWDYEKGCPVFRAGEPVLVERAEAVAVWAWKALHTPRYRHEMYTWDYGSELESLIGQNYTEELKQAEARRYVEEALLPNPYITGVRDIGVDFGEGRLRIRCTIDTVYGAAEIGGGTRAG